MKPGEFRARVLFGIGLVLALLVLCLDGCTNEGAGTGLPLLRDVAEKEGPKAIAAFDAYVARAQKYLPAPVSL